MDDAQLDEADLDAGGLRGERRRVTPSSTGTSPTTGTIRSDRLLLKAEGALEYQALLFLPSKAPFDLYYRDQDIRPAAARPARARSWTAAAAAAAVTCASSRAWSIRATCRSTCRARWSSRIATSPRCAAWLTRKVLDHLAAMQAGRRETYLRFWGEFGTVLKEGRGRRRDRAPRPAVKLLLFHSTREGTEPTSLADYVARMPDGQESIYYVTGESRAVAERSPHLEAFLAKGYEVLFFVDPIDEFVAQSIHEFDGKPLVSVARAGVEPGSEAERKAAEDTRKAREPELRPFLAFLEQTLAETIREARVSSRLTTSPACLVTGEHDPSPGLERLLRQASGKEDEATTQADPRGERRPRAGGKLRAMHAAAPGRSVARRRRAPAARGRAARRGTAPPDPRGSPRS